MEFQLVQNSFSLLLTLENKKEFARKWKFPDSKKLTAGFQTSCNISLDNFIRNVKK